MGVGCRGINSRVSVAPEEEPERTHRGRTTLESPLQWRRLSGGGRAERLRRRNEGGREAGQKEEVKVSDTSGTSEHTN